MKKTDIIRNCSTLIAALLCTAEITAQTAQGIHICTSTEYDYARHKGIVSVESFVEGEIQVIKSGTPLDIVLVLDVSGSMDKHMNSETFIKYDDFDPAKPTSSYYDKLSWMGAVTGGYVTKLGRMMDAAYSFVESIEANAQATGLPHKVGIVTFSSTNKTRIAMELTEVKGALSSFRDVIYGFKADGATASDEGLRQALKVFENANVAQSGREQAVKSVLLFTDGEPTNLLLFEANVANDAITAAHRLKSELDCKIYTVGMFDDDVNWWVDYYMNAVSSNYPSATAMDKMGDGSDKGYYTDVSESGNLSVVFDGISEEIIVGGAKIELTETAQIRDYMPPYMQLPEGTSVEDIHIYTCRCVGYDPISKEFSFSNVRESIDLGPDGITISHDEDGCATVSVTGFNYKEHWCGPGMTSGRKLIVHIPFELSAVHDGEFNPNRHESGLYDPEGHPAGSFDVQILRFFDLTIECTGLCSGESTVYRLMDAQSGKFLCRFALGDKVGGQEHSSAGHNVVRRVLKNVPEGNYILIEEGWNWAYTTLPAKEVNFSVTGDTLLKFNVTHKSGAQIPLHTEVHLTNK